jgi:hypothetical protein
MASRTRRRRRQPHKMRWHKFAIPIVLIVGAVVAAGGIAAAWALNIYHSAPPLKNLKPVQKGRTSAIYTAEGKLIGYIHSENVRQPISGSEIPKLLKNATISIEDKNERSRKRRWRKSSSNSTAAAGSSTPTSTRRRTGPTTARPRSGWKRPPRPTSTKRPPN